MVIVLHINIITNYHYCTSSDLLVGVEEKYCPALKTELSKVSELCSMNTKDLLLEATYALNKTLVNKTEISHVWGHMYSNIEDQRTTPYTSADEESENNVKVYNNKNNRVSLLVVLSFACLSAALAESNVGDAKPTLQLYPIILGCIPPEQIGV